LFSIRLKFVGPSVARTLRYEQPVLLTRVDRPLPAVAKIATSVIAPRIRMSVITRCRRDVNSRVHPCRRIHVWPHCNVRHSIAISIRLPRMNVNRSSHRNSDCHLSVRLRRSCGSQHYCHA